MTYGQLEYYHKNRNNILEKRRLKREEETKLNDFCKVKKHVGRGGYKWKGEKIKCMKVKKGEFKIHFD
jgi:hypothetical protein